MSNSYKQRTQQIVLEFTTHLVVIVVLIIVNSRLNQGLELQFLVFVSLFLTGSLFGMNIYELKEIIWREGNAD